MNYDFHMDDGWNFINHFINHVAKIKKNIFDDAGLRPGILRYVTFSFTPIVILVFVALAVSFCKQEAIQLLINNLCYLKEIPFGFVKILIYMIKIPFYLTWIIIYPSVLLWLVFNGKFKLIIYFIFYVIVFFMAWTFSFGLIVFRSGLMKVESGLSWVEIIIKNNYLWQPVHVSSMLFLLCVAVIFFASKDNIFNQNK